MNTTPTTLAQDTTNLRRGTYKGLGSPVRFYYWGTEKNANDEFGTLVTSVTVDGTKVTLDSDFEVRTVDVRTRIWISDEAPVETTADADKVIDQAWARTPEPTGDTKAIVKAAKPSRNAKLHPCKCGCGAPVRGLYKQGHDARHASDVAKKALAALASDPDLNLADNSLLDELPTDALKAKAAAIIAKRITK